MGLEGGGGGGGEMLEVMPRLVHGSACDEATSLLVSAIGGDKQFLWSPAGAPPIRLDGAQVCIRNSHAHMNVVMEGLNVSLAWRERGAFILNALIKTPVRVR